MPFRPPLAARRERCRDVVAVEVSGNRHQPLAVERLAVQPLYRLGFALADLGDSPLAVLTIAELVAAEAPEFALVHLLSFASLSILLDLFDLFSRRNAFNQRLNFAAYG